MISSISTLENILCLTQQITRAVEALFDWSVKQHKLPGIDSHDDGMLFV